MSAETRRALEDAIAAHVASEYDDPQTLVTGYALIVSGQRPRDFDDETTCYLVEYPERQPFHVGLGLVHRHRLIIEGEAEAGE